MSTWDGRVHGGTDDQGVAQWDFSSNANACGPCPDVEAAVRQADPRRYPDPAYTALSRALAGLHGVEPERILLGTSASEWVQRLSAWARQRGQLKVWWPRHAYGDYAQAASAWGLEQTDDPLQARLAWLCEPSSPLGQNESPEVVAALLGNARAVVALDCAYVPLRLDGVPALTPEQRQRCWQIWSPNKALGLTGVRAAYAIAPPAQAPMRRELESLAASWPVGSHGVAMLQQWCRPQVQAWVQGCLPELQRCKERLLQGLERRGWRCLPSHTPFFCAQPPAPLPAPQLRARGIKLRDATSFGWPGWWRLSAQNDEAVQALLRALDSLSSMETSS